MPPRMISKARRRRLEADDRRHLWHPFTQQRDWEKHTPLVIEQGLGVYLQDIHGRRYLDGVSSIWVNIHGHQKSALDRALRAQLKQIAHSTLLGLSNVPAIELAKELLQIAPAGLTRVFYSDNGSTAVEVALKMAFQYWQLKGGAWKKKTRFLRLGQAYHGDTLGAVSVGGIPLFHERFRPLLFPTFEAHAPYCYRCPVGLTLPECRLSCADAVEDILKEHHEEIAGIIVEPMLLAAGGMITMPSGYLKRLRRLATRYGVLFIADEVATGFGRTGRMFACEHEGVKPDLMAISKGLTGGYMPLAATLTTEAVYREFLGRYEDFKTFFHGHSYTGNPLGCAVALANLAVFKRERTLEKLLPRIEALRTLLRPLQAHSHVGDVRQIGLIAGIELVRDRVTKEPYSLMDRMGTRVTDEARAAGLLLRPLGNIIVLMPPLSTTTKELRMMVHILAKAIAIATGVRGLAAQTQAPRIAPMIRRVTK
jgi:adenosylmethionine-8-amino-7-oxononanoate aminotransferase